MKESDFRKRLHGAAFTDDMVSLAKEAGAKFEPEGPPKVPEMGSFDKVGLKGWVVAGYGNGFTLEECGEVIRRASQKTWNNLLEMANTDEVLSPDYKGRLDIIHRILKGEE